MKTRVALGTVVALFLAVPYGASDEKPKKPKLELRGAPRMAFSPVNVFFTAELVGGDDVEEYYCPELEWEWDDGGKSTHQPDCPPYGPDTKIERRFTAEHQFDRAGVYNVRLTFKRTGRPLLRNSVRITVRPGLGDPSREIN